MTQKTLAEQIAEMQNNLIALDKIITATIPNPVEIERRIKHFEVVYKDGTKALFIEDKSTEVPAETMSAEEVLKVLRKRHVEPALAPDPKPRKELAHRIGYACIINGVKYNSLIHASRVLKVCRHTIKTNIESGRNNWSYV